VLMSSNTVFPETESGEMRLPRELDRGMSHLARKLLVAQTPREQAIDRCATLEPSHKSFTTLPVVAAELQPPCFSFSEY
jgi:hypothetical protein